MGMNSPLFSLLLAARQGLWPKVLTILDALTEPNAHLNTADERGITLLMYAVVAGQRDVVSKLLSLGVDVNQTRPPHAITPLMLAASHSQMAIAQQLLSAGAAVNQGNDDGSTALMIAAYRGDPAMVTCLLQAGAAVNQADHTGETPFSSAMAQGRTGVMQVLLKHGAMTDLATGLNAVIEGQEALIRVFLQAGWEVNQRDDVGDTALHLACLEGHAAIVQLLLGAAATVDVDAVNDAGDTPLLLAIAQGETGIVAQLMQAGANPNLGNGEESPLALTLTHPDLKPETRPKLLALLLQAGAKVDTPLPNGQLPLQFAQEHCLEQIISLLQKST